MNLYALRSIPLDSRRENRNTCEDSHSILSVSRDERGKEDVVVVVVVGMLSARKFRLPLFTNASRKIYSADI